MVSYFPCCSNHVTFFTIRLTGAHINRSNPLTMHTDKSTLLKADCGGLERRLSLLAPQENHRMSSVDHITYIDKGEGSPKCDEPGNYQSCNGGLVVGLLPLRTKHKVERQLSMNQNCLQPKRNQATNNHTSKFVWISNCLDLLAN